MSSPMHLRFIRTATGQIKKQYRVCAHEKVTCKDCMMCAEVHTISLDQSLAQCLEQALLQENHIGYRLSLSHILAD